MGRSNFKNAVKKPILDVPVLDVKPKPKPIQYTVLYPKVEKKKEIKNDNIIINIVEDDKIQKHNNTKKHLNFINKDINSSWYDILNNDIYVINLNRYIDRFVYFKKEASRLGFKKVIRVSGFDGNIFRHEEEQLINTNIESTKTYQLCYNKLSELGLKHSIKYVDNWDEKPFVGGQLGCAVSHYETIKNAYDIGNTQMNFGKILLRILIFFI